MADEFEVNDATESADVSEMQTAMEPEDEATLDSVMGTETETETQSPIDPETDCENEFEAETAAEPETESDENIKREAEQDVENRTGFQKFLRVWNGFWKWIFHLRSIGLAIPIAIIAILLARYNLANLPEQVGLNIQSTGAYEQMVDRDVAVYAPLALTGACIFLMLCSRKVLYPLLISIFSLALPLLIWVTNTFPN